MSNHYLIYVKKNKKKQQLHIKIQFDLEILYLYYLLNVIIN